MSETRLRISVRLLFAVTVIIFVFNVGVNTESPAIRLRFARPAPTVAEQRSKEFMSITPQSSASLHRLDDGSCALLWVIVADAISDTKDSLPSTDSSAQLATGSGYATDGSWSGDFALYMDGKVQYIGGEHSGYLMNVPHGIVKLEAKLVDHFGELIDDDDDDDDDDSFSAGNEIGNSALQRRSATARIVVDVDANTCRHGHGREHQHFSTSSATPDHNEITANTENTGEVAAASASVATMGIVEDKPVSNWDNGERHDGSQNFDGDGGADSRGDSHGDTPGQIIQWVHPRAGSVYMTACDGMLALDFTLRFLPSASNSEAFAIFLNGLLIEQNKMPPTTFPRTHVGPGRHSLKVALVDSVAKQEDGAGSTVDDNDLLIHNRSVINIDVVRLDCLEKGETMFEPPTVSLIAPVNGSVFVSPSCSMTVTVELIASPFQREPAHTARPRLYQINVHHVGSEQASPVISLSTSIEERRAYLHGLQCGQHRIDVTMLDADGDEMGGDGRKAVSIIQVIPGGCNMTTSETTPMTNRVYVGVDAVRSSRVIDIDEAIAKPNIVNNNGDDKISDNDTDHSGDVIGNVIDNDCFLVVEPVGPLIAYIDVRNGGVVVTCSTDGCLPPTLMSHNDNRNNHYDGDDNDDSLAQSRWGHCDLYTVRLLPIECNIWPPPLPEPAAGPATTTTPSCESVFTKTPRVKSIGGEMVAIVMASFGPMRYPLDYIQALRNKAAYADALKYPLFMYRPELNLLGARSAHLLKVPAIATVLQRDLATIVMWMDHDAWFELGLDDFIPIERYLNPRRADGRSEASRSLTTCVAGKGEGAADSGVPVVDMSTSGLDPGGMLIFPDLTYNAGPIRELCTAAFIVVDGPWTRSLLQKWWGVTEGGDFTKEPTGEQIALGWSYATLFEQQQSYQGQVYSSDECRSDVGQCKEWITDFFTDIRTSSILQDLTTGVGLPHLYFHSKTLWPSMMTHTFHYDVPVHDTSTQSSSFNSDDDARTADKEHTANHTAFIAHSGRIKYADYENGNIFGHVIPPPPSFAKVQQMLNQARRKL